ncbi:uncharacterized protein TNCV_3512281 [Trichonephila clavipes]|nr:uncharacterized protein TNCV_3512281 [Trichonephila clavipes]
MRAKAYCDHLSIHGFGPEVHEQLFQSGGQFDANPPVLSFQASLIFLYQPTEGMKGRVDLAQPRLDIEDINQRIETTEVGLKLLMYSLKNSENVNINLNDNGKNSIRLPQIPLPEFSGVIAEFSNFKNQFINLISNNEQLNDSQKLYYLRASLKGEAKLLESPSDSFDSLFKALEDRYENKRQLIDSHVLEIINYEKNL